MVESDSSTRLHHSIESNVARLLAYFYRRVQAPEDAGDLLNETLLILWRKKTALPGDDTEARMWMYGVARRVLSTHRRTEQRRSALHTRLRIELADSVDPTHHPGTEWHTVHSALESLDTLDQEIIRLVYWDGLSLAEASRLLELPEGTVRSRHHRARTCLKQHLSTAKVRDPR